MKNMQDGVPATRKDGLTISTLDDEVLVYDPEARRASCLNSFAAEVLARCDGQSSASDITRELPFKDVDERLVWLALADLQKAQLLQDRISIPFNADGRTNRRDLLKRIGMGTAVAVPIVTGLALPAAAAHGTCKGIGSGCTQNHECCSKHCCNSNSANNPGTCQNSQNDCGVPA